MIYISFGAQASSGRTPSAFRSSLGFTKRDKACCRSRCGLGGVKPGRKELRNPGFTTSKALISSAPWPGLPCHVLRRNASGAARSSSENGDMRPRPLYIGGLGRVWAVNRSKSS